MNMGFDKSKFRPVDREGFDAFLSQHNHLRDNWSNGSRHLAVYDRELLAVEFTDGRLFVRDYSLYP